MGRECGEHVQDIESLDVRACDHPHLARESSLSPSDPMSLRIMVVTTLYVSFSFHMAVGPKRTHALGILGRSGRGAGALACML